MSSIKTNRNNYSKLHNTYEEPLHGAVPPIVKSCGSGCTNDGQCNLSGTHKGCYECRQNSNKNPNYPSHFCWAPSPTPLPS